MQPWEYGSVPKARVAPLTHEVDEVWACSRYVRDCYLAAGIPADQVHVVHNGVDCQRFHPAAPPLPLPTQKPFKFLFVGGTLQRKGIDVLLDAWARTFSDKDDVCLVIKDMGVGSFYKGQTAEHLIAQHQQRPGAAEIVYLDQNLSEAELAGLYTACDCLVHPYRGEGFALPIAEAMACALPVIVTAGGAADDFCDSETAWLIPARRVSFPERRVGTIETVDLPWLLEPDVETLARHLKEVVARPAEVRARGWRGCERIRQRFSWAHAAEVVEQRLRALRERPIRREQRSVVSVPAAPECIVHGHRILLHDPAIDRYVSAPLAAGAAYEPFQSAVVLQNVRLGDVVVDVGANIGYYTLLLARHVGPQGKVYAFEPDPANFALLKRNVERNGYSNVVLVPKAVADRNGAAQLFRSRDNQGDHRLHAACEERPAVDVETIRLDDYFTDASVRLSLIKMDIQGAEGQALAGMRQVLARSPEVRIVCGFWPHGLHRAGDSAATLPRAVAPARLRPARDQRTPPRNDAHRCDHPVATLPAAPGRLHQSAVSAPQRCRSDRQPACRWLGHPDRQAACRYGKQDGSSKGVAVPDRQERGSQSAGLPRFSRRPGPRDHRRRYRLDRPHQGNRRAVRRAGLRLPLVRQFRRRTQRKPAACQRRVDLLARCRRTPRGG
jgi:FkbM family methyltransferase